MAAAPTYGRLGASAPGAATDTTVYAPAAGRVGKVKVRVTNRSTTTAEVVRVYHCAAATIAAVGNSDYAYTVTLAALAAFEIDNEVVRGGHCIGFYSTNGTSTMEVIGIEQDQ